MVGTSNQSVPKMAIDWTWIIQYIYILILSNHYYINDVTTILIPWILSNSKHYYWTNLLDSPKKVTLFSTKHLIFPIYIYMYIYYTWALYITICLHIVLYYIVYIH